jgi:uncharacterized protein YegP (UPF0339 family)
MATKKIRVKKTRNKQFRFVLVGDNGEIIATSETYKREKTMMKTIDNYFYLWDVEGYKLNMILPPKTKPTRRKKKIPMT